MKKGFTLIELLIVVAIIAILAAIAVPNFLEAQVRAKVSRSLSDMRSLATAIESYYVDNNTYPLASATGDPAAFATGANANYNAAVATSQGQGAPVVTAQGNVYTFGARTGTGSQAFGTVTTPIGYITSYFSEPFANFKGATFAYVTDTTGNKWTLSSNGPDLNAAIGAITYPTTANKALPAVETSFALAPNVFTATYAYDPTNGTISAGDVFRLKQ